MQDKEYGEFLPAIKFRALNSRDTLSGGIQRNGPNEPPCIFRRLVAEYIV